MPLRKSEPRRHHANDSERTPVHGNASAHDCWIALEPALPQRVTDDHHLLESRSGSIARVEVAAAHRRNAEKAEHSGGDRCAENALGLVHSGEADVAMDVALNGFEGTNVLAVIEKIGIGNLAVVPILGLRRMG